MEDGVKVKIYLPTEYSIDGEEWISLNAATFTPSISEGQYISFRAQANKKYPLENPIIIDGYCDLLGNCNSLIYYNNASISTHLSTGMVFYGLFKDCGKIVSVAPNFLPSMVLENNCYSDMFSNCTSLKTAPELPATTLSNNCYFRMFSNCISLETAPILPATTLADNCYVQMYANCTSLKRAEMLIDALPKDFYISNSYVGRYTDGWLKKVSPTGTFVKKAGVNIPRGSEGIPEGWDVIEI